jgi:NAD(P)-dependent dehydrogenase (short-subunit alcohol dehydrogenase family)
MPVSDRTVFVTGGTSGLGLAMARALVTAGARVFVTGRDPVRLREAVNALAALKKGAVAGALLDVRDEGRVASAFDEAEALLGPPDMLVNNAGLGMRTATPRFLADPLPFWQVPPEGFRAVVATNLTGYFLVARSFVLRRLGRGAGRIVNVTMNRRTMVRQGFTPYGPARAGAEALSFIMARDLAGTGLDVNLLLPGGATLTGMIPEETPAALRASLLAPEVMGPPIVWLAGDEAAGLTGARIIARAFDTWLATFRSRERKD